MLVTDLTIRQLNLTQFKQKYIDYLIGNCDDNILNIQMLSIATIFLNCKNTNINNLGYRIILIYSNRTKDYKPLYDVAINRGLNPVSHYIDKQIYNNKYTNLFVEFNEIFEDYNSYNDIYYTSQQKELITFYNINNNESIYTIAPTSYGKTDLILSTFEKNLDKNICVITPTKALLTQTVFRLKEKDYSKNKKIIVYPEMYNGEKQIWAIMTQERLLRLLKNNSNVKFDIVVVDEAHLLLGNEPRNKLLASDIIILNNRNKNTKYKYFTPYLNLVNSLNIKYIKTSFKFFRVNEYIKTEMIYFYDMKIEKKLYLYDQFVNSFCNIKLNDSFKDEADFIDKYSGMKNIIYLNKSKDIEDYARKAIINLTSIKDERIDQACNNLADFIHPKYNIIDTLKKGILYHHGSIPDFVRIYIEKLYNSIDSIKYVITSSTLLEGVNLPADRIFILDYKKGTSKLSNTDFKNLIGRICRFNRIFNYKGYDLKLLQPEIYIINSDFVSKNANIKKFIVDNMYVEKKQKDIIENVLLENSVIDKKNEHELDKAEEFIENFEYGTIKKNNINRAKTNIGRICFLNNITELDILDKELELNDLYISLTNKRVLINNSEQLFDILNEMFFVRSNNDNLNRLQNAEARKFYSMVLNWKIKNTSYKEMIELIINYWRKLKELNKNTLVYVGRKWGELTREGRLKLWVDIGKKSQTELINLSIVRIKEEQDFLDNTIIKYIEVLNDLNLIDQNFYLNVKYGTCDIKIIAMIRNGLSLYLSKLLIEKYSEFILVDVENGIVKIDEKVIEAMKLQNENEILIAEAEYFL